MLNVGTPFAWELQTTSRRLSQNVSLWCNVIWVIFTKNNLYSVSRHSYFIRRVSTISYLMRPISVFPNFLTSVPSFIHASSSGRWLVDFSYLCYLQYVRVMFLSPPFSVVLGIAINYTRNKASREIKMFEEPKL